MIAEARRTTSRADRTQRSARLSWNGGQERLWIDVPASLAADPQDASPLLPACLLPAMRRHEDLHIDGPVSPRLAASIATVQAAFHAWDRGLRRCALSTSGALRPPLRNTGSACFFSRGIDSMHAALLERQRDSSSLLVFSDRLDTIQGEHTRAEELRRGAEAAAAIELPFVNVSTNLATITAPLLNWADMHGGGLAFIALSLAGGLDRMVVPSTHGYRSVGPWGSTPYVDPLWSTERFEVVHAALATRPAKTAFIAAEAPQLIPLIKVCFEVDASDNCGCCSKCLLTMVCLEVSGVLDAASSFREPLAASRVAALRPGNLAFRLLWIDAYHSLSLEPRHKQLRKAIERMLRRTARPRPLERLRGRARGRPPLSRDTPAFGRHRTNLAISVGVKGEPYP